MSSGVIPRSRSRVGTKPWMPLSSHFQVMAVAMAGKAQGMMAKMRNRFLATLFWTRFRASAPTKPTTSWPSTLNRVHSRVWPKAE